MKINNTNPKIIVYQIYFDNEQIPLLDPNFIPYDNTNNPNPQLREYYVWRELFPKFKKDMLNLCAVDYYGIVSWKFIEKTNLSGLDV